MEVWTRRLLERFVWFQAPASNRGRTRCPNLLWLWFVPKLEPSPAGRALAMSLWLLFGLV
ncbi:MAG: hypothetical protein LBD70_06680 [Bifidobacteriaceae bacterium]|nr:hypothetical protein [Bifidobacteriaceae bacterium]